MPNDAPVLMDSDWNLHVGNGREGVRKFSACGVPVAPVPLATSVAYGKGVCVVCFKGLVDSE